MGFNSAFKGLNSLHQTINKSHTTNSEFSVQRCRGMNEWIGMLRVGLPWWGGSFRLLRLRPWTQNGLIALHGNCHAEKKRSGGFGWVIGAPLSTAKRRVIASTFTQVCNKILKQSLYNQFGRTKANCKWRLRKGTGPDSTVQEPLAVYFLQDNDCWKLFVIVAHNPVRSFPVSLIIWCSKVSMPAGWRQGQISG